jgi:FeS assembly SUF system protein
MKQVADKEMVKNAVGDQYDSMAEPPYTEVDRAHPLAAAILKEIREVYDPEIPVNVFELGLLYKVDINEKNDVFVQMTLTSPGCPVAGEMPGWIQGAIFKVEGVNGVDVELVFDPPWTPDMMAETAKLELNMF